MRSVIANDLECTLTAPISSLCTAFHIFVTGADRDFKFGVLVGHSKSQPAYEKSPPKGVWLSHVTHLKMLHPWNISGTAKALQNVYTG